MPLYHYNVELVYYVGMMPDGCPCIYMLYYNIINKHTMCYYHNNKHTL